MKKSLKMKFKSFAILILISVFLSACKQTALGYNDVLIGSQVRISELMDTIFNENTSPEKITELRKEIVNTANLGLSKTLNSKAFDDDSELKDQAVKYYSFVSSYFSDENLDSIFYLLNSDERIEKLDSNRLFNVQRDLNTLSKFEDELKAAQSKFSEAHKLNLTD